MKKILSTFLCACLVLGVAGCGKEKTSEKETKKESNPDTIISCEAKESFSGIDMDESIEIAYAKDNTLNKVQMIVTITFSEEVREELTDEAWEAGIKSAEKELRDEIDNKDGIDLKFESDKSKYSYTATITYDLSKMSKEDIEDSDFGEYVSEDGKFDVDRFWEEYEDEEDFTCTKN